MIRLKENLAELLVARKRTAESVAVKLGCSPMTFEAWMTGSSEPKLREALALANELQIGLEHLLTGEIRALPEIKLLCLDIDGVLTDGSIYLTENGDEIKRFYARDGRAIMTALKKGIEVAFISGGTHPKSILQRASRLGVKRVHVGKEPKLQVLAKWLEEIGIGLENVAHIGDDANDLELMAAVGYCACPADAAIRNKELADLILQEHGGRGCVREFIELHLGIEVD